MSPDKPQEQSNPQLTQRLPHSGDIGLERPVEEFDKTPLSSAVDQGLVNIPDTAEPLVQPQAATSTSERKKGVPLWAKVAAPITAAAALGGGLVALSGGSSEKSARSDPTEQAPGNPDIETGSTENTKTYGNIDLSSIDLGPNPITAIRPNGEQISVPSLDTSTPQRLGLTALDLLACYMTTGDDKCLSGFSKNPDVQRTMIAWRQSNVIPILSDPNNKDFQQAIFDSPDNPAIFTSIPLGNDRQLVELSSGTLYYGRFLNPGGSNKWQGEETRKAGVLEQRIYELRFFVLESDTDVSIDGMEWDIRQTSS